MDGKGPAWWNQNGSSDEDIITASSEESGSGSDGGEAIGMAPSSNFFFDQSDSEDDIKRTIKTAKDKRFTELDKSVKKIKNSMKINDWSAVFEEWTALQKLVDKSKPVLSTSGLPSFYIVMVVSLEDLIAKAYANKEMKKNMKPKNAKALNAMKQHFNKYKIANEYGVADKMEACKKAQAGKTPKGGDSGSGGSDDGSGSGGSDDDPTWDDPTPGPDPLAGLDDESKLGWTQERIDRKVKEMLSKRGTKHYDKKEHLLVFRFLRSKCDGLSNQLSLDFHVINALFDMANPAHPMSGLIWKKVYNCLVSIVDTLVANDKLVLYEAKEDLVAAIGDDSTEKLSQEKRANVVVGHLMFSLERLGDEYYHSLQNIEAPSEQYLTRLSYENPMLRLLQYAHNYYSSKNDVKRATIVAQRMLSILYYRKEVDAKEKEAFQAKGREQAAALPPRVINTDLPDPTLAKRVFKPVIKKKPAGGEDDSESEEESNEEEAILEPGEVEEDIYAPPSVSDNWDLLTLVPQLVSQVCKHSPEERSKRKAILQLVYHLALHGKFYEARDCLLMTHLQEKINKASFALQVLFNRAMVQLGFAAFRIGRIKDAHNCLSEIASGGKSKELLAQGVNPRYQSEKSKEQEKQEYRRQIPYHMHINLELLECIHLVCAMLLEVPNMAQCRNRDNKRKVISKFFQKVINYYDRQLFTGPPENTRESIIIAAKALEQGDWKKCRDDILALPIWQLLADNEGIKVLVAREIQEQAIRTYLFSYGRYYDSLSLAELCAMFELEKNEVHSLVSKMIINEDLHASWDQPTGALIIHGQDPTALQSLALSYAEKISVLSETSETIEQRNFVDRRGPMKGPGGKEETYGKYGPSYVNSYSQSFQPNFNYSRGAVGVGGPNQARQIPRAAPAPTSTRSPATVSLQATGGFVQQQKKGKARAVGRK